MRLQTPARFVLFITTVILGVVPGIAVARSTPSLPQEKPSRGLVYDGLVPSQEGGPCDPGHGGHFEIRSKGGRLLGCTHGPDPVPAGEDLASPSAADLRHDAAPEVEAVPCLGDGMSGYRVQAIYAHPSDMSSRFPVVLPAIQSDAASNVDDVFNASAAETGATRRVRFVTDASCQLDVDEVPLSGTGDDSFSNTISELRALGYTRSDRKYLVWMDTPAGRASVYCGIGQLYFDETDAVTNYNNGHAAVQGMFARADAGCWGSSGTPVEAHELMHNLGGVQRLAPHSTSAFPSPAGGHCTDDYDVMCYDDDGSGPAGTTMVCGNSAAERRFDCGDDDYFSTAPSPGSYLDTHWNTADSRFLGGTAAIAPPNDGFQDAQDLEGSSPSATGSTVGATRENGEPVHAGQPGGASVWYRWQAPSAGPLTVRTVGSTFDTLLAVYSGSSMGGLGLVAANDDASTAEVASEVTFEASGGATYRIAVDGYSGEVGAVALALIPGGSTDPTAEEGTELVLAASRKRVRAGQRVRLTVIEPGCTAGDEVELVSGSRLWAGRLTGCVATFRSKVTRRMTFRAFVYDEVGDQVGNSSPVIVRVSRR